MLAHFFHFPLPTFTYTIVLVASFPFFQLILQPFFFLIRRTFVGVFGRFVFDAIGFTEVDGFDMPAGLLVTAGLADGTISELCSTYDTAKSVPVSLL